MEAELYSTIQQVHPRIHIIPASIMGVFLRIDTMNAIDEDIQNAFKYKFAEKPRGGTNIAVVHINTNSSLDAVTKIHHQGVYITARLPSQDVKPDINMKSTKKLLKELDIPFIESSVPGYMHWVSQSVLNILSS